MKTKDNYGYGSQIIVGFGLLAVFLGARQWVSDRIGWTLMFAIIILFAIMSLFRHQWHSVKFWLVLIGLLTLHTLGWLIFFPENAKITVLNSLLIIIPEGVLMIFAIGWFLNDKSVEED